MIIFASLLYLTISTCDARPSSIKLQNVATVPPNCLAGQEWVNGECRDVWRKTAAPANVVTVPPNCPDGQEYVNGQCRDVWRHGADTSNVVSVPPNCPSWQVYVNGQCRDVWRQEVDNYNVVTAPPNCPNGQEYVNGQCRDVWMKHLTKDNLRTMDAEIAEPHNVVTAPPNCPSGQQWINGQCRDIWRSADISTPDMETMMKLLNRQERQVLQAVEDIIPSINIKNVISVPNQCPNGYKPDSLGVCRPIMDYV